MKLLTRFFAIGLILLLTGCPKGNEGFDAGGPITRHLKGIWKLDKVVTPSRTKVGPQIGYTEIFESGNDQVEDYDKIYRNDSLIATYIRSRNPYPIANASNMTVTAIYVEGVKRFFRILQSQTGGYVLETSAYLKEVGTAQDSVKYYYSKK